MPIRGASEQAEEVVRAHLGLFDGWAGPGRLALSEIRFEDDLEGSKGVDASGAYFVGRRLVVVDTRLPLDRLGAVLRHELCHALDYSEGLLDAPTHPFDSLGAEVPHDARTRRSEALAQVCELAPLGAAALAEVPCVDDDLRSAAAAAWVSGHVWTAVDVPPARPLTSDLVTEVPVEGPFVSVSAAAWDGRPTGAAVSVTTVDDATTTVWVDLGEPPPPPPLPPLEPRYGPETLMEAEGSPADTAAAVVRLDVGTLADNGARALVGTDGEWHPVEGTCLGAEPGSLYASGAETWWVHGVEREVVWSKLAP